MKTFIATVVFVVMVFMGGTMWGQNLVPNFSFEQIDSCPSNVSQFNLAEPWFMPTLGTTDLYSHCNGVWPHPNVEVPANWCGYQNAKTGLNYAGFFFWFNWATDSTYREYLEVPLENSLEEGIKYYVSFHLSLCDSCGYSTDRIGAYFSYDSLLSNDMGALSVIPQIESPSGNFMSDTSNWIEVKGSFVATEEERFITIGNFHNNETTDTISTGIYLDAPFYQHTGYFYIDDVCVSTDSLACFVATGISSSPLTSFSLSPNPVQNLLTINSPSPSAAATLAVYDALGRKVKSYTLPSHQKTFELSVAELPAGVYLVAVNIGGRVFVEKVVKE